MFLNRDSIRNLIFRRELDAVQDILQQQSGLRGGLMEHQRWNRAEIQTARGVKEWLPEPGVAGRE